MNVNRRGFIELFGAGVLSTATGGFEQIDADVQDFDFDAYAVLVGPESARPLPDGQYFDRWDTFAFLYVATDTGQRSNITHDDSGWAHLETRLKPYAQSNLPAADVNGRLVLDDSRGVPAWVDADHYEFPNFVDDVLTSAVTKSNFSTKTEYWSFDTNAGSLIKGRKYELKLAGVFGTANTSDQFTVVVDVGGNEIGTLQNAAANVADKPWSMETIFTVREHGTTGKIKGHSIGTFNGESRDDSHSEVTIDTTVAETVKVSINWNSADADNTVTLEQGHMKQMA